MSDPNLFHRPGYAQDLARPLLEPGPLDQGLRSGVFLSGIRRIGKTTFIRQDFIPTLLKRGALTLYVDLWTDRTRPPLCRRRCKTDPLRRSKSDPPGRS